LKQDLIPQRAPKEYASKEEVDKVIKMLEERLGEGQVSVHEDELLAHGHSPNTYHCELISADRLWQNGRDGGPEMQELGMLKARGASTAHWLRKVGKDI
jgi:hypothetical protein